MRLFAATLFAAVLAAVVLWSINSPEVALSAKDEQAAPLSVSPAEMSQNTNHDHHADITLPDELTRYVEDQRINADELEIVDNADGSRSLMTKRQWSTVSMVVIDENGKRHFVERQVTPIGTVEVK